MLARSRWEFGVIREGRAEGISKRNCRGEGVRQVLPIYFREDLPDVESLDSLPGEVPFLRGVHSTMYVTRPWTIRQYAGFSSAEESNIFFKNILSHGGQGLSVAFDLPTHRGYDSDNVRVAGDVGKTGVAIDSVEDMKTLFHGIPLNEISVSMTMNGAVLPVLASFVVAAREMGSDIQRLTGTIQNDILKEFLVRNTYIYPPRDSMRIVTDIVDYMGKYCPKFNPISISGYHFQEAGASPELELALTIKNGVEYVEAVARRGMSVDEFGERLSFFFCVGMDFYTEIAKLRAARVLWSEAMASLGAKSDRSKALRMHCQTSGVSLTVQEPYNNIARTTIEAMAAIFGGTQSLHTNSYDEAIGIPSDAASRIARSTQLILQHETKIGDVIDPWAGSYMMEAMTHNMVSAARRIMKEIDESGGVISGIENGSIRRKIEECASERQAAQDSGDEVVVGVNRYRGDDYTIPPAARHIDDDNVLRTQKEKLRILRLNRNDQAVQEALARVRDAAKDTRKNLLAVVVDAMSVRATVGEVSDALGEVFGRFENKVTEATAVYSNRYAGKSEIDLLKKEVEEFSEKLGEVPKILIAKLGQDGHDRGSRLIASGFSDFGFEVELGPLFATPKEIVNLAFELNVHAIGISSLAGGHRVHIPELLAMLNRSDGSGKLVFVGGIVPDEDKSQLLRSGVSEIFDPGTPVIESVRAVIRHFSRLLLKHNPTNFTVVV
ncbi:methylmalonyl-CoA mutase [Burkholderia sp. LMG 21824]|uniref:methylmalonyl-CoA mutase n=1 Tax=Burkholderia sp. LMG 21824 TaxID=3158172 RepID=UPI003C2E19C8